MAIQEDVVSLLEEKIKQVILVAERFKVSSEQLKQQVEELHGQLRARDKEMEILESKYQNLKFTKTVTSSSDDIKNVKLQVSRMIREIDRCIALLNR